MYLNSFQVNTDAYTQRIIMSTVIATHERMISTRGARSDSIVRYTWPGYRLITIAAPDGNHRRYTRVPKYKIMMTMRTTHKMLASDAASMLRYTPVRAPPIRPS